MGINDKNIIKNKENDEAVSFQANKEDNVFGVPDNYFSEFPAKVLAVIRLKDMDKNVSYSVSDQYFSEFPNKILKRIEEEELPFLKTLSKENVYTVPENYFENFGWNIIGKINKDKVEAKIIPFKAKRKRWQMAAAAAVVAAAVLSSGLFLENRKSKSYNEHQYYASVLSSDSLEQSLSGLSNSEINGYLSSPNLSDSDVQDNNDVQATQNEMDKISNESMENYLSQTPAVY